MEIAELSCVNFHTDKRKRTHPFLCARAVQCTPHCGAVALNPHTGMI